MQISALSIEQLTMGSACPKPALFLHSAMIFDRNSPHSWSHCKQYCSQRPVVDPHMVYSTFVHLPVSYEFSTPAVLIAKTVVYHFQQLYRDRSLEPMSGDCGDATILDDRANCFFNYCFQDLSHIQSFLMGQFNLSAQQVRAMSKEVAAAQQLISAKAKAEMDAETWHFMLLTISCVASIACITMCTCLFLNCLRFRKIFRNLTQHSATTHDAQHCI
jgi:hypothetical protein